MPGPMGGPMRRGQSTEKPKDFKKTTKKLIDSYLSKYKIGIIIVIIFAIGSTIFTIVGPKILGNATTEIFNGLVSKLSGGSGIDFGKVGQIALMLLGLYLISAIFSFVQGFTMTGIAQKLTYRIRNDIVSKINITRTLYISFHQIIGFSTFKRSKGSIEKYPCYEKYTNNSKSYYTYFFYIFFFKFF